MCSVLFLPVQSPLMCFRSSLTRFADFVSLSSSSLISLPQTVGLRLFYVSLRSQAPQQQYTVLSFSSMRRHGQSQTDLHVHYGITLWAYLSQTHRPIALHCMHYGITLSAYLSEPLVKDSRKTSKFDRKRKQQYRVL